MTRGGSEVSEDTHNLWRETGAVGEMNNRVIEIVKIRLIVRL